MIASQFVRQSLMTLLLASFASAVFGQAQPAKQDYEPTVGQEGKDVVWVPTSQTLVDKMLDMAKVTSKDFVMDLGSGDGRTVITAAKRGARAVGIEYNPEMVELSKRNAAKEGVTDRAQFMKADLFETDLSKASVITMFLLPDINLKLRPKILDLKPGIRVVSNSFTMGDWKADETATVSEGCNSYCTAYLWIVPAKVNGRWQLPDGELTLKQSYQMVTGTLKTGNVTAQITGGKLNGDRISFSAGGSQYTGQVNGDSIEGAVKGGSGGTWSARRASKRTASAGA
jgi:methyltransferase family protein